jgi:putative DNA primase/helicase
MLGDFCTLNMEEAKVIEKDIVETYIREKKGGTYKLAEYIVSRFEIITVGSSDREMYIYQDGYYKRAENDFVFPEVQRILTKFVDKNAKTEALHKIQDMTTNPRNIFQSASVRYIPVLNGIYDTQDKTLLPHSYTYHFKYQIPVTYNAEATCPVISKFLDDTFTEDQRATVEEWIGYQFYRQYSLKKALIIVGEGDTGKTTFLEMMIALVGPDNISGVSLHKMAGDKFASAQMYDKHSNIVDELSASDVSDTGNFKIATGGGSIIGEYKYGDQFSFKNFAKLTFACNKIPDVKDVDDEAYFNRWMVIHLEKTIEKKILNFIEQLTTSEELSGLFNIAMSGLERLLEKGEFTYKSSGIDTKREMMLGGSSVGIFVSKMLEQRVGAEMSKSDLYDVYAHFCTQHNLAANEIKTFGKKLQGFAPYIMDTQIYDRSSAKGKQVRGWKNVIVKKDEEEQRQEDEDIFNMTYVDPEKILSL